MSKTPAEINPALEIPDSDLAIFAALPIEVRNDITIWQREFLYVYTTKPRTKAFGTVATRLGVSYQSVRDKFYDVDEDRHWSCLINQTKVKKFSNSVPVVIVDEFRRRCELNQRKSRSEYVHMMREWRRGELTKTPSGADLPWPESVNGGIHPEGCSYENLMRLSKQRHKQFEQEAMRNGLGKAMAKHGPMLRTTRVGLWPGSHYFFDDLKRDMAMVMIAKNQKVLIQEIGALELLSGDRFAVHRRPQFIRADGKRDSVKESEMRFMVANVFRNFGYSERGTEIPSELGTATIREELAEFLAQHSNGKIKVRKAGITGKEQAILGYYGKGGGNPRTKAPLESLHNLIQNMAGSLPAQVGHDRKPPEWLFGLEAITEGVCKALATLPTERAGLLMVPMLEYWQGLGLLADIDHAIAHRTDHELEGYEQLGFTTLEYRRDPRSEDWLNNQQLMALPGYERDLLVAAAMSNPDYRRARKLSPREVFSAGTSELVKFPDHVIALMFCDERLGEDLRVEKSLTAKGEFAITDQWAGPGEMYFEGHVVTPHGELVSLQEATKYGVVLNPWDAEALWVYDRRGGYLGTAARTHRVCQADSIGMGRALGQWTHKKSLLLKPLRERHANVAIELEQIQLHNALVIAGAPVTAIEKNRAENLTAIAKGISSDERAAAFSRDDEPAESAPAFSADEISDLFRADQPEPADFQDPQF